MKGYDKKADSMFAALLRKPLIVLISSVVPITFLLLYTLIIYFPLDKLCYRYFDKASSYCFGTE